MRSFLLFLASALAVAAAYAIQSFRTLSIFGVDPNLALLVLLLFLFSRIRRGAFFGLLASLLLVVFIITPFWVPEACMLAALLLLASFFRRSFTAHESVDFFLFVALGPVLFYGLLSLAANVAAHGLAFSLFSLSLPAALPVEIVYDLALGALLWFPFHRPLSRAFAAGR